MKFKSSKFCQDWVKIRRKMNFPGVMIQQLRLARQQPLLRPKQLMLVPQQLKLLLQHFMLMPQQFIEQMLPKVLKGEK